MQKYTIKDKEKFDEIFGNKQEASKVEKDFIRKTQKYIKYIKWIPGIKMVGIGNSISMNSATNDSDIDLLIVSDENKMWVVRIFCTLIFQIMGVRKTPNKHAGRMCLSFFCTLKGLDFGKFSLDKDPYLYFWILYFKPILNYNNTYNIFLEKNKNWADFNVFNKDIENNKKYILYTKNVHSKYYTNLINSIIKIIDNFFKKIFLPKTIKSYESKSKPFGVIINDDLLKFHDGDIRKEIAKKMG